MESCATRPTATDRSVRSEDAVGTVASAGIYLGAGTRGSIVEFLNSCAGKTVLRNGARCEHRRESDYRIAHFHLHGEGRGQNDRVYLVDSTRERRPGVVITCCPGFSISVVHGDLFLQRFRYSGIPFDRLHNKSTYTFEKGAEIELTEVHRSYEGAQLAGSSTWVNFRTKIL